jgi:putative inorganic carbon (HCO3(-)) transporter
LSRLLGGTIFYALLVLLVVVAIPYGSAEAWWEAFFECAVFAICLLWIIEGLLSGSWLAGQRALWLPVLALIAYCIFQSLPLWPDGGEPARLGQKIWYAISADPFETRRFTLKLVALSLYGLLLTRYASSGKRLRLLVHVIIAVALASALFGMLRQTTQREIGFLLPFLRKGLGYGQFINQNHFAFLMEMALGLVLGLLVGRGVRRDRILIYLATLLPIWTALVLSNSRGGLLGMLGQLIFVALLFTILPPARETTGAKVNAGSGPDRANAPERLRRMGRSLPVRLALAGCLVLAMALGVVLVGGEPMMGKLENVHAELDAQDAVARQNASRREIWRATWQLIKAHPLAGVGFGGYWAAIPTYHDASGELTPQQAHNDYLELLASGGVIGVALACWLAYAFFRRVRVRLRAKDTFCRAICFGALAGIFGIAVHSIVDFGLHITVNALVFVVLLVLATADCQGLEANSHAVRRHPKTAQPGSTALDV